MSSALTPEKGSFSRGFARNPRPGKSPEPESILCLWPRWFAPPVGRLPAKAKFTGFPIAFSQKDRIGPRSDVLVFTRGSVSTRPREFFAAAIECCRLLKRRGLLVAPHGEDVPANLPPEVTHVPYADVIDVFARSAAVVHHGGMGTIACGNRAGIRQLALPMIGEQFDLANRMRRMGVGRTFSGAPTAERLARAAPPAEVEARGQEVREAFVSYGFRAWTRKSRRLHSRSRRAGVS